MTQRRLILGVLIAACLISYVWAAAGLVVASNFGDTWRGAKLAAMVDGTAERPYVYRRLVPMMISGVITVIGEEKANRIHSALLERLTPSVKDDIAQIRPQALNALKRSSSLALNLVAVLIMFASVAGYGLALANLAKKLYPQDNYSIFSLPLVGFILILPLIGNVAYIYDPAVLFLSAACYAALAAGKWRWYYLWFLLACINKESSIFIFLFFAFWYFSRMDRRLFVWHIAVQSLILTLVRVVTFLAYADNPGVVLRTDYMALHLPYISDHFTFTAIAALIAAGFLLFYRWREKPAFARAGMLVLFLVAVSYFIFGKPAEYRVFYDALPLVAVLFTHSLASTMQRIKTKVSANIS